MKLLDAKFHSAVHVNGKEVNYARGSAPDAQSQTYEISLEYNEELKTALVVLRDPKARDEVAYTTFANVVYCRPAKDQDESSSVQKGNGASKGRAPKASVEA